MDTAQHQLDALLQAQGQGEDDADTPIPTLDIDAGDQETARANKKKRKASDNSAADDYFSEYVSFHFHLALFFTYFHSE